MTYSKGTWDYDAESGEVTTDDRSGDWCVHDKRTLICTVNQLDGVSNGLLIAEALAMLEALNAIVECCEEDSHARDFASRQFEIRGIARAAIARVEGRS